MKLSLCKGVWQISQNITNIPRVQGIPAFMGWYPLQYQLLWIQPHVYNAYIHSSIPAQLFSVEFAVIIRSTPNLPALLWLQNVGNIVFERVDFESHCKKLQYQNRKKNSCLFLFSVAEHIVAMKSRDQRLLFRLYSLDYSSLPCTGETFRWRC